MMNIAYISRKKFRDDQLYDLLLAIREIIWCAPVDEYIVDEAIRLKAGDFEDALQFYSAKGIHADCIVTRNKKDFNFSDIKVVSPKEFLASFAG